MYGNDTNEYFRKINYYETDKMGITHHSNYIRFMEEARIRFLEQIGCAYCGYVTALKSNTTER